MSSVSTLAASNPLVTGELVRVLEPLGARLEGDATVRLTGVHHDSRAVVPGDLFVALSEDAGDRARHVGEAIARGAVAVLARADGALPATTVPVLRVTDARRAMAFAAEAVLGWPSRALRVVGVTGTNGKTTTTRFVTHGLRAVGMRVASLGTLGFDWNGALEPGIFTTPEADEVSRRLAMVRDGGGTHLVMEVSSHGLELHRVAGLTFDVAAFTNLTQDHLDFHGTMEAYARAKARLFDEFAPRAAVINVDDAFGRALVARVRGRCLTVGRSAQATVRALDARADARGIRAEVDAEGTRVALESPLIGAHNLENLLVALGALMALDVSPERAAAVLSTAEPAAGRLERCDGPDDDVLVVVDYAHTPDALERVLAALRPLTRGAITCVFGCGGDRDPGKRPKMGAVAAAGADRVIVTNDNPRTEDPQAIAAAIVSGFPVGAAQPEIELDRARAITRAIREAAPGDTVLLAGKGHETYQIFGEERRPFDDRVEARRALAERRGGSA
ncbi:MAG: UDP-N-acetylmuramoyl-L-alanyl-D-glutamate--2,6-diaminopimelate ligase [Pseudomonadota bacterium]|nr:MAG: UDP-N-acetylmuramoyl-L-alanyl-D-glutamate--2,6-diaminopimelate ligase [Pseudomonadota bacterium]